MNKELYAKIWQKESENFNMNGIYEKLANLIPNGKVLEIGCGCGFGTYHLCKNHKVLSLDNNSNLIKMTKKYLTENKVVDYKIHNCDFFELTQNDKKIINQFNPNIIVGWFLGAGGNTVDKYFSHVEKDTDKVILYREKIEDFIISKDLLSDSIDTINLASRNTMPLNLKKEFILDEFAENYNTFIFSKVGFKVTNIEFLEWDFSTNFPYSVNRVNSNEELKLIIVSITAKRINL